MCGCVDVGREVQEENRKEGEVEREEERCEVSEERVRGGQTDPHLGSNTLQAWMVLWRQPSGMGECVFTCEYVCVGVCVGVCVCVLVCVYCLTRSIASATRLQEAA